MTGQRPAIRPGRPDDLARLGPVFEQAGFGAVADPPTPATDPPTGSRDDPAGSRAEPTRFRAGSPGGGA